MTVYPAECTYCFLDAKKDLFLNKDWDLKDPNKNSCNKKCKYNFHVNNQTTKIVHVLSNRI